MNYMETDYQPNDFPLLSVLLIDMRRIYIQKQNKGVYSGFSVYLFSNSRFSCLREIIAAPFLVNWCK